MLVIQLVIKADSKLLTIIRLTDFKVISRILYRYITAKVVCSFGSESSATILNYITIYYFAILQRYIRTKIEQSKMSAACAGPPEQMGIGQTLAWTYYYGYLKLILPGFTDRVKRSRYWNEDSKNCKIVPKLFIILPDSCLCPPIVSEGDPMMTPGEHLEKFEAARAGNPRRSYTNFIYKLADHQDKVVCS